MRDWIKIKNVRHQELVICGWIPGTGRRAQMIGSLVLGGYAGARLQYAGNVGTGFTDAMLTDLMRLLARSSGRRARSASRSRAGTRGAPVGGTAPGRRGRVNRADQ